MTRLEVMKPVTDRWLSITTLLTVIVTGSWPAVVALAVALAYEGHAAHLRRVRAEHMALTESAVASANAAQVAAQSLAQEVAKLREDIRAVGNRIPTTAIGPFRR